MAEDDLTLVGLDRLSPDFSASRTLRAKPASTALSTIAPTRLARRSLASVAGRRVRSVSASSPHSAEIGRKYCCWPLPTVTSVTASMCPPSESSARLRSFTDSILSPLAANQRCKGK